MGRQVVRLATDGDGQRRGWLDGMDGISVDGAPRGLRRAARCPSGTDPELILRAALDRGERVTRFEIGEPSLEEIFIEHVGRPAAAEEERHLAATSRDEPRGEVGMTGLLPNAWHIARREYRQRTQSRTFVIVTVFLALDRAGDRDAARAGQADRWRRHDDDRRPFGSDSELASAHGDRA